MPQKLTTDEIMELADKLSKAPTAEEADELEHRFMEGFYGQVFPYAKMKREDIHQKKGTI